MTSGCVLVGMLCLAAMASAQTSINFDLDASGSPLSAPQLFSQANPLRDTYSAFGVHFEGPSVNDGGAILKLATGTHSGSNALAFNSNATLANGACARDPERIFFDQDITEFSIFASGSRFDTTFFVTAFNAAGDIISDTEGFSDNGAYVQLNLTGTGIRRIELSHEYAVSPAQPFFMYDDMRFTQAGVVPGPGALWVAGAGFGLTGLKCLRRGRRA